MSKTNQYLYIGALLLSVTIYGIPFEYGGNALRLFLGALTLLLVLYLLWRVWKELSEEGPARMRVVLWLFNSLAFFHLALIYVAISFSNFIWIVGLLLGALIYYLVQNYIRQVI